MTEMVYRARESDGTKVSDDFLSLLSLISLRSWDDVSVLRPTAAIANDVARALGHGAPDQQVDAVTAAIRHLGKVIGSAEVAELDLGDLFGRRPRSAQQRPVSVDVVERSLDALHGHARAVVERYHYTADDSRTAVLWRAASAPLMSTLDEVLKEIDYQGVPTLGSPMWESHRQVAFLIVLVLRMRSELGEGSIGDVMRRVFGVMEADGATNHIPEALAALRNGGLMARGAAGQRKYGLNKKWATIGIARLREEILGVIPVSEDQPQQATQQESAVPAGDDLRVPELRWIQPHDIYQTVLGIFSDESDAMSQADVNNRAQSRLGIPDIEAHYVKPDDDRTLFSSLIWNRGLQVLLKEEKVTRLPGNRFQRAANLSTGESVVADEQTEDMRPEGAAEVSPDAPPHAAYREYAIAKHNLAEMEGRESAAVAGAGFDLIGWRQPVMTPSWTMDAFAYCIVEDAASLHDGLADQMLGGFEAIRSYLRTKPELEHAGVSVSGHVLVWRALPKETRQAAYSAWNTEGKTPIGIHLVPMPDLDDVATAIVKVLGEAGDNGMHDSLLSQKACTATGKSDRVYRDARGRLSRLGVIEPIGDDRWRLATRPNRPAGRLVDGRPRDESSGSTTDGVAVDSSAGGGVPKTETSEGIAPVRPFEQAASAADAIDDDWAKRFGEACRAFAVKQHALIETEELMPTVAADAGFDFVGWRKSGSVSITAFAYRIVPDSDVLDQQTGDEVRSTLKQVEGYLRGKSEFESAGVNLTGHVLTPQDLTLDARRNLVRRWNPKGVAPVGLHRVPWANAAGATVSPPDDSSAGAPESPAGSTVADNDERIVLPDPFVPHVTWLLLNILKDAEQPLTAREIEALVLAEQERDSTDATATATRDDITRARGGLANAALIDFDSGRWTVTAAGRSAHDSDLSNISDAATMPAHAPSSPSPSVVAEGDSEGSRRTEAEIRNDADATNRGAKD